MKKVSNFPDRSPRGRRERSVDGPSANEYWAVFDLHIFNR